MEDAIKKQYLENLEHMKTKMLSTLMDLEQFRHVNLFTVGKDGTLSIARLNIPEAAEFEVSALYRCMAKGIEEELLDSLYMASNPITDEE